MKQFTFFEKRKTDVRDEKWDDVGYFLKWGFYEVIVFNKV